MSQSSPDLTTRDVLQQVNRRLELIEGDVRNLNQKLDARFGEHDAKTEARFAAQDARFAAQDATSDTRFRWIVGLILVSWMSTMGTLLFRLGPLPQ